MKGHIFCFVQCVCAERRGEEDGKTGEGTESVWKGGTRVHERKRLATQKSSLRPGLR